MRALLGLVLWLSSCGLMPAHADYLSRRDLVRIVRFLPQYEEAARIVGVPALALPAIHYLESDLSACPTRNVGGPFMLDMGYNGDGIAFDAAIKSFEQAVCYRFNIGPPDGPCPRVRDDFFFSCLCAAWELKQKAGRNVFWLKSRQVDEDVLADAFWGYNGRAYGSWRKSPYVWNDPHRGRVLPCRVRTVTGCMVLPTDRPGALILYRELARRLGE